MFRGKTLTCAIAGFAAFLVQFLEGPPEAARHRVWISLKESHQRFSIGMKERNAWMKHMQQALTDAGFPEAARRELLRFFRQSSAYLVNRGKRPVVNAAHALAGDWKKQVQLDELVAAIRRGEAPHIGDELAAIALRRGGRTLLHLAAGAGCLPLVLELLRRGMDPNVTDGGGHTPLYSVGNECKTASGVEIVHVLVRAGANVNAAGGVKHCTPLHMAARRGNLSVASALLESGADIEAHDSKGDTPLRRAANCRKPAMVEFLRSHLASR